MRTTVTLDDDVLLAVRERAQHEKRTVGQVLSDLSRQALAAERAERAAPPEGRPAARHGFAPLPRRGAPVSNPLIDWLRESEPE